DIVGGRGGEGDAARGGDGRRAAGQRHDGSGGVAAATAAAAPDRDRLAVELHAHDGGTGEGTASVKADVPGLADLDGVELQPVGVRGGAVTRGVGSRDVAVPRRAGDPGAAAELEDDLERRDRTGEG